MISEKYYRFFFLAFVYFFSFNVIVSNSFASKINPTCEITNTNINCVNIPSSEIINIKLLNDPYRIQIKFSNKLKIKKNKIDKDQFIKSIRVNQFTKAKTKLVIEFKKPTIISDIEYYNISNQSINLNMYFSNTSEVNYAIAKHALYKNEGDIFSLKNVINISTKNVELPIIKQKFNKIKLKKNYVVFIDPGHGGKDPGAIGQLGSLEKNITLNVSILLAKELRKNKKINPILSRNKDVYLSLRKRILLAKYNKADIFVSIHADSSKNKKAKGISVFSLSDKASDKEALLLAKRENEVDSILNNNKKIEDPLIYGTLIKMFQREAMNDSAFLAKKILSNLEKTKLAVNRGHRFAGFTVLKSYDIPSVLIEIGFLSNKQEEKKLTNSKYLNKLSKNLAIAIENYFVNNQN
jgi:N-acetylmuramoyl-L-alanine amidase